MAANWWLSSQRKHFVKAPGELRAALGRAHGELEPRELFDRKLSYTELILHVALGLGLRQRVSSTAIVYFRRFFLKNSFVDFSGPKIAATCLYVAAKTEESPVQAGQVQNQFNRTLASKPFAGDPFLPSAEVGRLGSNELLDLELVVLQQLDFYLVVFHPHRDVVRYVGDIGLEQAFLEDAWLMVNDTYRTDLCLLFPPYVIALGVLFALGHAKKQPDKIVSYLQEAGVDDAEVRHVCMELVNLYTKLGRGHPGVDVP
jgi:cyclin C